MWDARYGDAVLAEGLDALPIDAKTAAIDLSATSVGPVTDGSEDRR